MKKTILDDGFYPYLTVGANFVGEAGIPELLDLKNTQIPRSLIPFEKIKKTNNKRQYVHFYEFDYVFADFLTATNQYVDILKEFDGVITPDCTLLVGQSKCLQETNTYFNRATGYYLQKQGIPVIPNVRWSDETSYDFCFLGIPKHSIVSISTHGCFQTPIEKELCRKGLEEMLRVIEPTDVLVHGRMPEKFFSKYFDYANFYCYPSLIEQIHNQKGGEA